MSTLSRLREKAAAEEKAKKAPVKAEAPKPKVTITEE
tara:strand:- start:392 stop:502 length:111 start_codon:yes stop_codon:yes gene_type:complete